MPSPDAATDTDIALERVALARAYVDCRERHKGLADWVRGL